MLMKKSFAVKPAASAGAPPFYLLLSWRIKQETAQQRNTNFLFTSI